MMRCLSVLVALVAVLVGLPMYMWPYVCCDHHQLQELPPSHGDPCAATGRGVAADVQERGFAYLPNVLSEEDIETLLQTQEQVQFNALPGFRTAAHVPIKQLLSRSVFDKVKGLVADIEAGSDVKIGEVADAFGRAEFMVTDSKEQERQKTTSFPWHQDHGFNWESGEPRSLGMYFMLRKPIRTEAGIMVVPMDRLRLQSPSFYEIAKNSSGTWFTDPIPGFPGTTLADAQGGRTDEMHALNYTLDDISCTPESGAGDLLILRGDIPHRTQPHQSFRMSVNMRVAPPDYPLTRLLSGSFGKAKFMAGAEDYYVARMIRHYLGLTEGAHCGGIQHCGYRPPESDGMKLAVKAMDFGVRALIRGNLVVRGILYQLRFMIGYHVLNEELWPYTVPPAPMDR